MLVAFLNGQVFASPGFELIGLPEDVRILATDGRLYFATNELAILMESSTWSPVPPGCHIPNFTLYYSSPPSLPGDRDNP